MKIAMFLIISFIFFSCSRDEKKLFYLIPKDYTGWVNIIYDDPSSGHEPFTFKNGYVYIISGNPAEFKVKTKHHPTGWYDIEYFYYDNNGISKLCSNCYPKANIFFETTIGSITKGFITSFYVSKDSLLIDGLSHDDLPTNPKMVAH